MSTFLAFIASLFAGFGEPESLSMTDVRFTLGVFGPPRADTKVLPGDRLVVSFDIAGITADEDGKILYSIGTELSDSKGKLLFRQPQRNQETIAALGGGRLPAFAQVDVGLDQPAGNYTLKVTVKDRASDKSASLTRSFTVLPRAFGLVRLSASRDPDDQLPAFLPAVGQTVWLHLTVVGFERDKDGGQPNVLLEVRIRDEQGKVTTARPLSGTVNKDVPGDAQALPMQFPVLLNRGGKFTLELKATDKVSGKSVEFSHPFGVRSHR